jgi:hypothetical protein
VTLRDLHQNTYITTINSLVQPPKKALGRASRGARLAGHVPPGPPLSVPANTTFQNTALVLRRLVCTNMNSIYTWYYHILFTYDHRILRTRLPVRSALFKQDTGGLVVRWVTTSESPLLYVFAFV